MTKEGSAQEAGKEKQVEYRKCINPVLASIVSNPGMDVRKLYVIKLSELEYILPINHLGGFQLVDLIITKLKSHMTC